MPDIPEEAVQVVALALAAYYAGEDGEPLVTAASFDGEARIALDALAGAGFSVVPTGDLRAYLYRKGDLKTEVGAMRRLREIAGPERTPDAG